MILEYRQYASYKQLLLRNKKVNTEKTLAYIMCGLTAVLALQSSTTKTSGNARDRQNLAKEIDDSLEIVKHRGPDARGRVRKFSSPLHCTPECCSRTDSEIS